MKLLVVNLLERMCCLLHWIPWYDCRLALWSSQLDERWNTGSWNLSGGEE